MHLAHLTSYLQGQENLCKLHDDPGVWAPKAILIAASSNKFSTDRAIQEYATEI
jgi:starch phosphorylase